MTRETQLANLATRTGTESKALRTLLNGNNADVSALLTTDKSSLMAAINELQPLVAAAATILDSSNGTGDALSASEINTRIAASVQQAKDDLTNGAATAYDTLIELQNEIQSNDGQLATLLAAQALRVRVDAAQSFTTAEQTQARANIDAASAAAVGDTDRNFVTDFEAALV